MVDLDDSLDDLTPDDWRDIARRAKGAAELYAKLQTDERVLLVMTPEELERAMVFAEDLHSLAVGKLRTIDNL